MKKSHISPKERENESMNKKALIGLVFVALLITGACSSANTNTTSNTNNANAGNKNAAPAATTNTAATPAPTNAAATAEGSQDFTLRNQTGVEIDKVFVSPSDKDDWEEDILGRDTLPNGESVEVKFSPKEKAPMWDLRIEDKEGTSIEWTNLNLMEISEVTLKFENRKPTAEVK